MLATRSSMYFIPWMESATDISPARDIDTERWALSATLRAQLAVCETVSRTSSTVTMVYDTAASC